MLGQLLGQIEIILPLLSENEALKMSQAISEPCPVTVRLLVFSVIVGY